MIRLQSVEKKDRELLWNPVCNRCVLCGIYVDSGIVRNYGNQVMEKLGFEVIPNGIKKMIEI